MDLFLGTRESTQILCSSFACLKFLAVLWGNNARITYHVNDVRRTNSSLIFNPKNYQKHLLRTLIICMFASNTVCRQPLQIS